MTDEQPTGTDLVRFETTDRNGAVVQAAVPAELAERYPTLGNADEIAGLIDEVFGEQGGTLSIADLVRITVPDGKSVAFTVGDEPQKTVQGIILVRQPRRNYWEKSIEESGGNEAPDCTSRDGVNGVGQYGEGSELNPSGLCESCPLSQWNEGADGKRIPPPCKQQEMLLVLTEDSAFPYVVTVPRTSLKPFRDYWKRDLLARRMKSAIEVETVIGLRKTANDGGVDYNELTFTVGKDITKGMDRETKAAYKAGLLGLAREFGEILRKIDTTQDEASDPTDRRAGPRPTGDPDDEGGISFDAPQDDDPTAVYASAGQSEK
ncbi:MAG: hypothetical protein HOY78_02270 [Saccharothrix sp.]|nr:hypothetical protein [Saccharothrix sp.]